MWSWHEEEAKYHYDTCGLHQYQSDQLELLTELRMNNIREITK
jgi:hypothetical protein